MKKILMLEAFIIIVFLLGAGIVRSCAQKTQVVTLKKSTDILSIFSDTLKSLKINLDGKQILNRIIQKEVVLYASDFADFRTAEREAMRLNLPLIVDSSFIDCDEEHIYMNGNLTVKGPPGKRGKLYFRYKKQSDVELFGIMVSSGSFTFENIDFICFGQNAVNGGSAIQTEQLENTYNLVLKNCNFIGGFRYCVQSSAGHGEITMIGCNLRSWHNCIQLYSQSGPKTLTLKNVTLWNDSSHCIYAHPNNNFSFDSVVVLQSGTHVYPDRTFGRELGINIYSTSQGLPGVASFQIFKRCFNAPSDPNVMWRLASGGAAIQVDSSAFPIYEWRGTFDLKNSRFWNAGNGAVIPGDRSTITNCTGEIWLVDNNGATVTECEFYAMRFLNCSNINVTNTVVKWLWYNKSFSKWKNSSYGELFNLSDGMPIFIGQLILN